MPEYASHIGKTKTVSDILLPNRIDHLASTLRGLQTDRSPSALFHAAGSGAICPNGCPDGCPNGWPNGWHWCFFNEAPEADALGRDGHEAPGTFIPELPLKRRMWASGKLEFAARPVAGKPAEKRTVIEAIEEKHGKTGPLIFVTLRHDVHQDGTVLVCETQTLVYREEASGQKKPAQQASIPPVSENTKPAREIRPDPVMLFRYSALTLNGHRIHYDADYARDVEGYGGIIFHAPLTATLLMGLAAHHAPGALRSFEFRALNAIEGLEPFSIGPTHHHEGGIDLAATLPGGRVAMEARAVFAPGKTV